MIGQRKIDRKPLKYRESRNYMLLNVHQDIQRSRMSGISILLHDKIDRFYILNKKQIDLVYKRLQQLTPHYFEMEVNDKGDHVPVALPKETWKKPDEPSYKLLEGVTQQQYDEAVSGIKNEPCKIYLP